jgi:hypothetical protein
MRVLSVVVTLSVCVGIASADTPAQEKSKVLFGEGRKLIEAHDDQGACNTFNEAIKLDPDAAGTMLNLGLCNQNLKHYRLALFWFRKAQARASETNLPEYEAAARTRTKDLVDLVASVKFEVAPDSASVKLDGEEILAADFLHVEIDAGHHTIEASAPHHKRLHQELDVVGRGGQSVSITLIPGEDPVAGAEHWTQKKKIGALTGIGGVALLGASLAVNVVAYVKYGNCTQDVNGMKTLTSNCKASQITSDQNLARHWGTGLFIGGAVVAAVGAFIFFTGGVEVSTGGTAFVPTVSSDGAGFAAIGHF